MQLLEHSSIPPWPSVLCSVPSRVPLAEVLCGPRYFVTRDTADLGSTPGCTLSKRRCCNCPPPPLSPHIPFSSRFPPLATQMTLYQSTPHLCPPWTWLHILVPGHHTHIRCPVQTSDLVPALLELQGGVNIPGNKGISYTSLHLIPSHFPGIISGETEAQRRQQLHVP